MADINTKKIPANVIWLSPSLMDRRATPQMARKIAKSVIGEAFSLKKGASAT